MNNVILLSLATIIVALAVFLGFEDRWKRKSKENSGDSLNEAKEKSQRFQETVKQASTQPYVSSFFEGTKPPVKKTTTKPKTTLKKVVQKVAEKPVAKKATSSKPKKTKVLVQHWETKKVKAK